MTDGKLPEGMTIPTAEEQEAIKAALHVEAKIHTLSTSGTVPHQQLDKARAEHRQRVRQTVSENAQRFILIGLVGMGILKFDDQPGNPGFFLDLKTLGGEAA